MWNSSSSVARSALNRLVVACRDEVMALDAAALMARDSECMAQLQQQSRRRAAFRRDLSAGVLALGGVPAKTASYRARLSSALRSLRGFLSVPHQGEAYAACARAAEKTTLAYSTALCLDLPNDVRFSVECQQMEVEFDHRELKRLRWGAE
jgi:uncharacterized protein (TIGR02284 family)